MKLDRRCRDNLLLRKRNENLAYVQNGLPKLCRSKKPVLITTHDKPVSVLLPIKEYRH